MMKTLAQIIAIAAFSILSAIRADAQNVRETNVKFMDGQHNAITADYDLPASVVKDALKQRLDKAGLSNRGSSKGFVSYKGTVWNEISGDKVDVYTKVTGKGSKSTVTILMSKGYDNFVSSASDPDKADKIRNFLNNFTADVSTYQLKASASKQEAVVQKANKDLKSSVSTGNDLSRDLEKLQKKIAANKDEQTKKQAALDQEQQKLDDLKSQIK